MSWVAAAVGVVGAVVGGINSSNAASTAAGVQSQAAQAEQAIQQTMYNTTQQELAPYLSSGTAAQKELDTYLGLDGTPGGAQGDVTKIPGWAQYVAAGGYTGAPGQTDTSSDQAARQALYNQADLSIDSSDPNYGSLLQPFSASDLNTQLAPNYAFMLDQGQSANKNLANLSGGAISGNELQGLDTFTQNYAQNAYQQAYNNYNTNQTNIYNRLAGVAQQGQNSAVQAGSNALTSAAQQSSALAAGGQAQASGIVGSANALAGSLNNASSYYLLSQIMNGSGSSSGATGNDPNLLAAAQLYGQSPSTFDYNLGATPIE